MSEELLHMKVTDRQSFIKFVNLLRQDFLANPHEWENNRLDIFLEAISAYARDIQGYYDNTGKTVDANKSDWQIFADILKGASVYE
jgi:hypothetical protein